MTQDARTELSELLCVSHIPTHGIGDAKMMRAELLALEKLTEGPWEIWTEAPANQITIAVLSHLASRGLCRQSRVNSTCERFEITDGGERRRQQVAIDSMFGIDSTKKHSVREAS